MTSTTPIRILHCVVKMDRGGYETFLMNVYRHICAEKIQFDFLASGDGVYDDEILSRGGKIHYIPFITKVGPFEYARQVRKTLRRNPCYNIVHSHMDKFSGMILREAHKMGIPVRIAHCHNTRNEGGFLYNWVKDYYGCLVLPHATDLLACSKDAAAWMYQEKCDSAWVVPNGIELNDFTASEHKKKSMREELNVSESFVVGHVGRFAEQKNHDFLLDIFKDVLRQKPNAVLLLVGDGPLRKRIEKKAIQLNIADRVKFLGIRNDVANVMQTFDVFVFPSLFEGLGMVLIEAQATGIPCVASSDIPEEVFVTNLVQKLSLQKTAQDWANAILREHRNSQDKSGLGKYDIEKVAVDIQQYYLSRKAGM